MRFVHFEITRFFLITFTYKNYRDLLLDLVLLLCAPLIIFSNYRLEDQFFKNFLFQYPLEVVVGKKSNSISAHNLYTKSTQFQTYIEWICLWLEYLKHRSFTGLLNGSWSITPQAHRLWFLLLSPGWMLSHFISGKETYSKCQMRGWL